VRAIAVVAALAACGGKKSSYDLGSFKDVVTTWLPDAAKQAWQGAWVIVLRHANDDSGIRAAVSIEGDRAHVFDGSSEYDAEFVIDRPCEATIKMQGRPTHIQFAYAGGRLVIGNGAVGFRRGEEAVVCGVGRDPDSVEEGVYALTGNHCTTWKPSASGWSGRDGVCVWSDVRGQNMLDVGTEHYATQLTVTGDFLQSDDFEHSIQRHEAERAASFAAAKQAVTAAGGDRVAQAVAAGGSVGDLSTIASVHASFLADKNHVGSVPLELPAVFVETSTLTVQGKVWNEVVVADPDHPAAAKLTCKTLDSPAGLAAGAKVVVRGKVDITSDVARLDPCSLGK
jgi:hypothetical protein